jgi:hypothetical protein
MPSINRFLEALLKGNHIPSPLAGEGRACPVLDTGVRGKNHEPHSAHTSQLAAGRFMCAFPVFGNRLIRICLSTCHKNNGRKANYQYERAGIMVENPRLNECL